MSPHTRDLLMTLMLTTTFVLCVFRVATCAERTEAWAVTEQEEKR